MSRKFSNQKIILVTCAFAATLIAASISYGFAKQKVETEVDLTSVKKISKNIRNLLSNPDENKLKESSTGKMFLSDEASRVEDLIKSQIKVTKKNIFKPEIKIIEKRENKKLEELPRSKKKEINNREMIELYAFNTEKMIANKHEAIKLSVEVGFATQDLVAMEENKTEELRAYSSEATMPDSDEIVFYDNPKSIERVGGQVVSNITSAKIFNLPISDVVKRAIKREIRHEESQVKTEKKRSSKSKELSLDEDQEIVVTDYTNNKASGVEKIEDNKKTTSSALSAEAEMPSKGKYLLEAEKVDLYQKKSERLIGYEFIPDYNRDERINDNNSGQITIGFTEDLAENVMSGIVNGKNIIPTRYEIDLNTQKNAVPVLDEEGVQKFLEDKKLQIEGSIVLVARNESIHDTELDTQYQSKIYLDSNLEVSVEPVDAKYIMFLGIAPGNFVIRYLLDSNESAQKIAYVGDGEMFYDDSSFIEKSREVYSLSQRNIMSTKLKELDIKEENFVLWDQNVISKKRAVNAYEISHPVRVDSERSYFRIRDRQGDIYVGVSSDKEIEVPNYEFIEIVKEKFNINSLEGKCLVQLNIKKELASISVGGKNKLGEMYIETLFLDKEGSFLVEDQGLSEKIFILGDMEGVVSAKLEYANGSVQNLKSLCAENNFMIEQL